MDDRRQQAFQKLRPHCIELSSVALKFRGRQSSSDEVFRALGDVYRVLLDVGNDDGLDEKLAEYAFFPLTHIFNETQRSTVRCLELAVQCLGILVEKGWRQSLSPQMGKQLMILLTIIAGGSPGQNAGANKPRSEELSTAAFECLATIFRMMRGPAASKTIYNEIGTATVIDQTVYVLLEAITDGASDEMQLAAVISLQSLYARITDRVVLASLLPRTVSALTKTLRPSTQMRRSHKVLGVCLNILSDVLRRALNDTDTMGETDQPKSKNGEGIVLDESWLKATASQVKLALANVIQLRGHGRPEVRDALSELCLMVVEQCQKSLADSVSMMIETIVVLAEVDGEGKENSPYSALRHLTVSNETVVDTLKSSLHTWIIALPRVMQSNDDTAKQRAIKQISTAFQILSQVLPDSDILNESMSTSLCDSVAAAVQSSTNMLQPMTAANVELELDSLREGNKSDSFQPVVLSHKSQKETLTEFQIMISKLSSTEASFPIAKSMISRLYGARENDIIAPFWLTLCFLKEAPKNEFTFDDMLVFDIPTSAPSRAGLIEEAYSLALPILTDFSITDYTDWRVPALALEAIALQAQQLQEAFRPELMDALYPVLQLLGSSHVSLRQHAMTCLNILTSACKYPDTSTMLVGNVDYLVNSVALKLNTFDVSPQAPQVLIMMIRLCGTSLLPYLDDLVGSIFAVLDTFHGYPKLVELLFSALGAVVDESAKAPSSLAITRGEDDKEVNHTKQPYRPQNVAELVKKVSERKRKRDQQNEADASTSLEAGSHPKRPWAQGADGPEQPEKDEIDLSTVMDPESEEPLPAPSEEEKKLSKSHMLLLQIAQSVPPHLSSPSPYLRRSLLAILARALPILAHDEDSFLPLINDVWPAVSARIAMPASLTLDAQPGALTAAGNTPKRSRDINESEINEETFVVASACETVTAMCQGAGDFMASRIEHEFPRWRRVYLRAWERVRADAEKVAERRQRQQTGPAASASPSVSIPTAGTIQPSTRAGTGTNTTGNAGGSARIFTPQHTVHRSLIVLFTTLLTHVRLPADIGDEICSMLATWIEAVHPAYYHESWRHDGNLSSATTSTPGSGSGAVALAPTTSGQHLDPVPSLQAMETWNSDLCWYLFEKEQRLHVPPAALTSTPRLQIPRLDIPALSLCNVGNSTRWKFAAPIF